MAKPRENQEKSSQHGGPRPNSGRKPKPVTEIKQALITELASVGEVSDDAKNDSAVYAFRLFDRFMRDEEIGVATRMNCATEILNRVWGKATERRENLNKNETTHIFVSQLTAALKVSYGQPSNHAPTDLVPVNGNGKSH